MVRVRAAYEASSTRAVVSSSPSGACNSLEVRAGDESGHGGGEFGPHLLFVLGLGEGGAGLLGGGRFRQPQQQVAVAEGVDDGSVPVVGGGDAADESALAVPVQHPAAVGSDGPVPASVVDFAHRRHRLLGGVAVWDKTLGEVFGEQDAETADLAQQAAGRVGRTVTLGGAGQQRGFGDGGCEHHVGQRRAGRQDLGLTARRWADDEQPHRVAVGEVGDHGSGHREDGRGVVHMQPSLEDGQRLVLGDGLRRFGFRLGPGGPTLAGHRRPAVAAAV